MFLKFFTFLRFISLASCLHICLAIHDPFQGGTSNAHILLPRRRGGGGGVYYKSCQEAYGSGYAECYGSCYNAGAGYKCCDGNYTCRNGQYCGYGSYAYCCYDYQTPTECASPYAIAAPPSDWKPGDGNALVSITNPPTTITNIPSAFSSATSSDPYTYSYQLDRSSIDAIDSTSRDMPTGLGTGNERLDPTSTRGAVESETGFTGMAGISSELSSGAGSIDRGRRRLVYGTIARLLGFVGMRRV